MRIYELPSDESPRFFGVDLGRHGGDLTCEVEIEILPDCSVRVLDIRHYSPAIRAQGDKT